MAYNTLFTHGPANVDSLLTTTRSALLALGDFLGDAIFTRSTTLTFLKKRAQVIRQGGASILTPLLYAKNSTVRAYAGTDVLDVGIQEGMTMARS